MRRIYFQLRTRCFAVHAGRHLAAAILLVAASHTILVAEPRPRTDWEHNGSLMYLEASGNVREFYYARPRPGMAEAGARPGSLLFSGEVVDGGYQGTAYIFSPRCGKLSYYVSGPILNNYRRVVMRGQAPRVNAACQVIGEVTDVLVFDLVD
jgi:hypothetical protein